MTTQLAFPVGRAPSYTDVVNAIASLRPDQLVGLAVCLTLSQAAALNADMDRLLGCPPTARATVCGFRIEVLQ